MNLGEMDLGEMNLGEMHLGNVWGRAGKREDNVHVNPPFLLLTYGSC